MKDKLLIGIILLLLITLAIETAYLIKIKSENGLPVRAFPAEGEARPEGRNEMPQPSQNDFNSFRRRNLLSSLNPFSDFKNIEKLLGGNFHTFETDKDYIIKGYMPGMEKGNIKINLEGDYFIISGENKVSNEDSKGGFYKSATSFNSFTQTVPVPENSDPSRARTEYKNGYVVITIPKEFSNARKNLI
jgi:HSP20 family molecular chaperone IbpA